MADPNDRIYRLLRASSNRQGSPYSDYASLEDEPRVNPRLDFDSGERVERNTGVSGVREATDRQYRELVSDLRRNGVSPDRIPSLTPTAEQVQGYRDVQTGPQNLGVEYTPPDYPTLSEAEAFNEKDLLENFMTVVNTAGTAILEGANWYDRTVLGLDERPRVAEFGGKLLPGTTNVDGREDSDVRNERNAPIQGSTGDFVGEPWEVPRATWGDFIPGAGARGFSSEFRSTEPGEAFRELLASPEVARPWAQFLGRVDMSNVNRELATWIMEFTEPDPTNIITPFAAALIRFGDNFRFTKMLDDVLANGGQQAYDDALEALQRRFDNTANMNFTDPAFGPEAAHRSALSRAEQDFVDILEANGVDGAQADHALLTFESEWEQANAVNRSHYTRDNTVNALAPGELNELERYTTAEYETLNSWLRGGHTPNRNQQVDLERRVAALDSAFSNPFARLPEDTVIYRGTTTRSHRLLPEVAGVTPADIQPSDLIGRTLPPDAGIQSWSEGAEVGYDFMRTKGWNPMDPDEQVHVLYQIDAPAGTPAISTAASGTIRSEAEILLPRGTQYRIKDAEWRTGNPSHPGYWFLDVEPIIPDQPPPMPSFGANVPAGSGIAGNPNFVPVGVDEYEKWATGLGFQSPYMDPNSLQPDELTNNVFSLLQSNSYVAQELDSSTHTMLLDEIDDILNTIGYEDLTDIHSDIADLAHFVGSDLSSEAAHANFRHVQANLYALANQSAASGYAAPSNLQDIISQGNPYIASPNALPSASSPVNAVSWPGTAASQANPPWIQPSEATPALDTFRATTNLESTNLATTQQVNEFMYAKGLPGVDSFIESIPLDERISTLHRLYDYDSPIRAGMTKDAWAELNADISVFLQDMVDASPNEHNMAIMEGEAMLEDIAERLGGMPVDSAAWHTGNRLTEYLQSFLDVYRYKPDELRAVIPNDPDELDALFDVVTPLLPPEAP